MKFWKKFRMFLAVSFSLPLTVLPVWALGSSRPADSGGQSSLVPIEVADSTLGGLYYFHDGKPLTRYRQLEDLVYPLRDYEANRLLKRSEASDRDAKIFQGLGLAGLLAGMAGLLTTPSGQHTGFWITAAGGGLLIDIGGLFGSEARSAKFNCVQRYNRFARGEEQVLPKTPTDEKALLDFKNNP